MSEMTRFKSLVQLSTPIREMLPMMASTKATKFIAGVAVVVDERSHVVGVVTDGDVRRGLTRGVSVDAPVEAIANMNPVLLSRTHSRRQMLQDVLEESRRRNQHYVMFNKLILVEDDGEFFDVIQLSELLEVQIEEKTVAVYGQGFVGLTLACALAAADISVIGIDSNKSLIASLQKLKPPFYESGLESLLASLHDHNPIRFSSDPHAFSADVHIITVGSPIGPDNVPDLTSVRAISQTISEVLKKGDLVVLRSTLPAGTTRNVVKPILESSDLLAGRDFYLAFAPERTAEGVALTELRTLPQVVGGYDKASTDLTSKLFSRVSNTVVKVGSLEEAELVKLANNTFRDLVFAFSNELAEICSTFNINAFHLIEAANEGYPRNRIPAPSPGVGGYCLTKDPHLYTHSSFLSSVKPVLGIVSRRINEAAPDKIRNDLVAFAGRIRLRLEDLRILVVGIAFKGMPETSDVRDSMALRLIQGMPNPAKIRIKDFVVAESDIRAMGFRPVDDLVDAIAKSDAVLIMNNHYMNNRFNVAKALKEINHPLFFFDGWNMFDQREIESHAHLTYATLGYITVHP